MSGRLDRWLAPKVAAARRADTLREIAAAPTTFAVTRDGATLPSFEGRVIVGAREALERRGAASASVAGAVTILCPPGTALARGDRLKAASGEVYLVTFVPPAPDWRPEAAAEVQGR